MRGFFWWPIGYTAIGIAVSFYFWGDPFSISAAFLLVLPLRIYHAYRVMNRARRQAAQYARRYGARVAE